MKASVNILCAAAIASHVHVGLGYNVLSFLRLICLLATLESFDAPNASNVESLDNK